MEDRTMSGVATMKLCGESIEQHRPVVIDKDGVHEVKPFRREYRCPKCGLHYVGPFFVMGVMWCAECNCEMKKVLE